MRCPHPRSWPALPGFTGLGDAGKRNGLPENQTSFFSRK